VFRKCPSCHWVFQAKEVKRDLLEAETREGKYPFIRDDPIVHAVWKTNLGFEKHVHTFRVTYKCKHCGHTWTDLTQKKQ
jgi:rubredoxin